MKHWKRAIALLTTVWMLCSLTACGGGGTPAASGSSAAPPAGTPSQASAPAVRKLKILAPDPGNPAIRWEDREEYPVYQKLKEMLAANGLEIEAEVVPTEQYQVIIQTRMSAASQLPDIANLSGLDNATVISLAKQGVIQPLTGPIEQYSNGNIDHMFSEVYEPAYPLTKTADGEMYWFPNLHMATYQGKAAPTGLTVMIRQDWLKKLNLETPTTLEQFNNVLRQFREQDANGNGQADEMIYIDVKGFGNGMAQWFGLGNDMIFVDPDNRKVNSPWYQEGVQDYFRYILSLVNDGYLDPSVIGSTDLATQRIAENKVGAEYAYGTAGWLNAEVKNVEGVDYEPLMPLRALDNVAPLAIKESAELVWEKYVITKECQDLEAAIKLFDMVYSDEYATLCAWGLEGESFQYQDDIKIKLPVGSSEEQAEKRISTGGPLWGTILPRVQLMNKESDLLGTSLSDIQKQYTTDIIGYTPWVPMMSDNYLAMPTDEETETINKLTTGLQTYSDELCTKICLGQASLDDWDSYMAEFDKLGLKELIAVQQTRMDRFYELKA